MRPSKLVLLATFGLWAAACGDAAPPGGGNKDLGPGVVTCGDDNPCPGNQVCVGGICEAPSGDGGTDPLTRRARLQVCTPDGCDEPYRITFGGSRVGVSTARTVTIRSIGELPLEIREITLSGSSLEFNVDPSGNLDQTLQPGEELAVRVSHTARDGVADTDRIEIISNADRARVLIDLSTEYKGVPSLHAGENPAANTPETLIFDFGNVRAGTPRTKELYLKNKDLVIDGSVLGIAEVRVNPASSTNFQIALSQTLPAYLNQFNSLCVTDNNCNTAAGDTCDTAVGVCETSDGDLRDILVAAVTFVGSTPGLVEEQLLVLSNDGGAGQQVRSILLRANVVFSDLAVTPDPILFPEGYLGFTSRQTVTVENLGTADVTVSSVAFASSTTAFSLEGALNTLPWVLSAQSRQSFDVVYIPTQVGSDYDTLVISSDDSQNPSFNVRVEGTAAIAPEMRLTPAPIDFGPTHVNANETVIVTVDNLGGSELRIPSIVRSSTTPAAFSADPLSLAGIPPGGQATFNVRFNPTTPTYPVALEGAILLDTNDPRARQRKLGVKGVGINPQASLVPSGAIDFNNDVLNPNRPSIYLGQVHRVSRELFNFGIGPLIVAGLSISGDTRNSFRVSNAPALPFNVQSGQSVVIEVEYAASATGLDNASLLIQTNDADLVGGRISVSLVGSTENCAARANATGTSNAAGTCTYQCAPNYHDINQDLSNPNGNGCEYSCTFQSFTDVPDDNFVDANCDGIDGNPNNAVFVAPFPFGNDNYAGSRDQPMATITNALARAQSQGRSLYVSQGSYVGSITLVPGVSIYGGYAAGSGWSRGANNTTTLIGSTDVPAITATGITNTFLEVIVDRLEIVAANASAAGANSTGVYIANSNSALTVKNNVIRAGNGAAGTNGANGTIGLAGNNGSPGTVGQDAGCGNAGLGVGGAGGLGNAQCLQPGGRGGNGGCDANAGIGGAAGTGGGGGAGAGGLGAQCCNTGACDDCGCSRKTGQRGFNGSPGDPGTLGGAGVAGSGLGFVSAGIWYGGSGGAGTSGGHGGGGGGAGGGGGGREECWTGGPFGICWREDFCDEDKGGGGGGGGGGGCGGTNATGGTGGGGSFGIFVVGNSTAVLRNNSITAGTGGQGGRGGDGGQGGGGGAGFTGGAGADDSGAGGNGGNGGRGGDGGPGGGGGGGVSYCIYRSASSPTITGLNCTQGAGGGGGQGGIWPTSGTRGNNGANGLAGNIF